MDVNFYKELLDKLYDGIYYVDKSFKISLWNKSAEKITGYKKEEVLDFRCCDNILRHINEQGDELCIQGCPLKQTLKDGKMRDADVYLHHKEGHRVPVSVRVSPILDKSENIIGAVEIFSENSKKMSLINDLETLKKEVYTDKLTQIGNRKFAEMKINTRFNEMRNYNVPFGILFVDIDHFKNINDTHGHLIGDQILKLVSKTISNILRSLDVICRWGGDEFIIILPNVNTDALEFIAQKIKMFIGRTWLGTEKENIRVTLSTGGTLAQKNDSIEKIVQRADMQMYQAKNNGRNTFSIH